MTNRVREKLQRRKNNHNKTHFAKDDAGLRKLITELCLN